MFRRLMIGLLATAGVSACSVNPVTGKSDLIFTSVADDIQVGQQYYAPSQQSQGGVYDVDPELTRYVQEVGQKLAAQSPVDLPYEFVILNNSVPNAWALPGGKMAINRGLLVELDNEAELAAVLGHEVVHAAARHSAQQQSRGVLGQVLVVATAVAAGDSRYGDLAVGGAAVGTQLISSKYGRSAELESDRYGMQYMSAAGYDPQGAVSLQQTFVRLSEGRNQDWLSGLFASHPPSQERVEANKATAAMLPPGGIIGEDRYQRAMQKTLDAKSAYDAYDEGRKALAKKETAKALELANKAIDEFPAEAHFHALRGDVRYMENNYEWAVTNYSRALDRRPGFFYYSLQRGMALRKLGQTDDAIADLERSIELMPTAPAHYTLGEIAEERGRKQDAIEHYRVVAKSGGEYGQKANARLARLELSSNPGAYIPHRCDADNNANLVVTVQNKTNINVRGVQIAVSYTDAAGRAQRSVHSVGRVLQPDGIASVYTGLGPYSGGACPVDVIAAEPDL